MSGVEAGVRLGLVGFAVVLAGLAIWASREEQNVAAFLCGFLAVGLALSGTSAWGAVSA